MKKYYLLVCVLIFAMAFSLTGCGSSGTSSGSSSSSSIIDKSLKDSDLSIDDFTWEVKQTVIKGERCYAMKLENASDYDLMGVEIEYKTKDDITDDELKLFDDFKKEHKDYYDEGDTFSLIGETEKYVASGDTIKNVILWNGIEDNYWSDLPTKAQFKVMEPDMLTLGVIGKDNEVYLAYYDFVNEEWSVEESSVKLNNWLDNDVSKLTPKPDSDLILVTSEEEDDYLYFDVYNASEDDFKTYVDAVKEANFTKDSYDTDDYYSADDKDGNSISISYYEDTMKMDVTVYSADKEDEEE